MTLEAVCKDLNRRWQTLHDQLVDDVLWSVTETKPDEEHTLAGRHTDAVTDLIAEVERAQNEMKALSEGQPNIADAGRILTFCQERFHRIASVIFADLLSYQSIRKLRRFGRERPGAWHDWTEHLQKALHRCRGPMDDLSRALLDCWKEIADRAGMNTVSVQNNCVGQRIEVPAERSGAETHALT
jgi:hypothetical protein